MIFSIDTFSLVGSASVFALTLAATLTDVFLTKPKITDSPSDTQAHAISTPDAAEQTTNTDPTKVETPEGVIEDAVEVEQSNSTYPDEVAVDYPPLSIIITPHENAYELEQNLPLLLEQDYPAPFKVIVVFWRGESETDDILKKYAANPHLYSTYIPESSRYMSRKKLAITVGEKASETEWLLLTDITCQPQSKYWLRAMARHASSTHNLVIGHTRYDEDTPPFRRFLRTYTSLYLMKETERGTAYRCEGNALMMRRSEFEERDGFRSNLKYLRGEYDFTVNECARPGGTAYENSPEGTLVEQNPTDKAWRNKLLYYMEDRQHMMRTVAHRWRYNLCQIFLHLSVVSLLTTLTAGVITQRWLLVAVSALLIMVLIVLRTWLGCRILRCINEPLPAWCIFPYELRLLWHHIALVIRYWRANKEDFITHKV